MKVNGLDQRVLRAVTEVPEIQRQVRAVAGKIRDDARRRCPKNTGALAKSIRVVSERDIVTKRREFRVSWDQEHYYGRFVEAGTVKMPARPFLRPAADQYR